CCCHATFNGNRRTSDDGAAGPAVYTLQSSDRAPEKHRSDRPRRSASAGATEQSRRFLTLPTALLFLEPRPAYLRHRRSPLPSVELGLQRKSVRRPVVARWAPLLPTRPHHARRAGRKRGVQAPRKLMKVGGSRRGTAQPPDDAAGAWDRRGN